MDSRLIKARPSPKPSLLKDYLLDDMSSCSSNGFKSFPRRQCCTTVRFLLEIELKNKQQKYPNKTHPEHSKSKNPSKSTAFSAIRSVISAVSKFKKSIMPNTTSLSKKLLSKSFRKRTTTSSTHKEIQRWISFDHLLQEEPGSLDCNSQPSESTTNDSKSNKNWSSLFTTSDDSLQRSSANSSSPEAQNLHFQDKEKEKEKEVIGGGNATNDDVLTESIVSSEASVSINRSTTTSTTTKQQNVQQLGSGEKEQLSPVSVLDCPFDDEEDEVSSPFQLRLTHIEGTKKKLMKKIQRFECLAQVEPINLLKRFSLNESDNVSVISLNHRYTDSFNENFVTDIKQEEDDDEEEEEEQNERGEENQTKPKLFDFLHEVTSTLPSNNYKLQAEKLLLDFFMERKIGAKSTDEDLLHEAGNWINGRYEILIQWEVEKSRQYYIKNMERGGEWKSLDQENEEVALELEAEVFGTLMKELLLDL